MEILSRKFSEVTKKYRKNQIEWERYATLAVSSLYGVDLLPDNVKECRIRLYETFNKQYEKLFGKKCKTDCRKSVAFILGRNILWGDALDLRTPDEKRSPIIFSEWSAVNGSMMKRRDFMLSFLLDKSYQTMLFDDHGNTTHLPEPVKEYPVTHFLEIANHGT